MITAAIFLEAIFAIQQCLNDNEEAASYWIDLAETYALQSKCLAHVNGLKTCQDQKENIEQKNLGKTLFPELDENPADVASSVEWKLMDKDILLNECTETATKDNIVDTRMSNCTNEECSTTVFEDSKCSILKSFAEKHHYCYSSLCSFLTAR